MTSQIPEAPAIRRRRRRFRMTGKKWLVLGLAVVLLAGVGVGTCLLLRPNEPPAAAVVQPRPSRRPLGTQTLSR